MKKIFKLFQKIDGKIIKIEYTPEDQKNYFKFLKKQKVKELKQVIITSEFMIKILEKYFIEYHFKINNIDFEELDEDREKVISNILDKINNNRAYIGLLQKELQLISEKSSIDINFIEIMSKDSKTYFQIKVNGFIIFEGKDDEEIDGISDIIREQLNG